MQNYKELNISVPVLRDSFRLPKHTENWHATFRVDIQDALHTQLLEFFSDIGLLDIRALMFRTPPHAKSSIHVDGSTLHELWAINWVWGSDHIMRWWKPNDPVIRPQNLKYTNSNTPYAFWTYTEATVIEQVKLTKPALIKVGVPHSVENFSSSDRWCLSVRSNVPSTWSTGLETFKDFLV